MGDHETCCSLVKDQLVCVNDIRQLIQNALDSTCIWNQVVYDLRPSLEQTLIPDASSPKLNLLPRTFPLPAKTIFNTDLANMRTSFFQYSVSSLCSDKIHFVNQNEDPGLG